MPEVGPSRAWRRVLPDGWLPVRTGHSCAGAGRALALPLTTAEVRRRLTGLGLAELAAWRLALVVARLAEKVPTAERRRLLAEAEAALLQ